MRYVLRNRIPPFSRVLVIESGSRHLLEDFLPGLYEIYGDSMRLDLLTCYAGTPKAFRPNQGSVYNTNSHRGRQGIIALLRVLRANSYSIGGMICSAEPILARWKWLIALAVPAKFFVLNENGDYLWIDRAHGSSIREFVLMRLGLAGAGAVPTLARLFLFPFTLWFLVAYAATVHLRRRIRLWSSQ
jgi:hypothetical protein